MSTSSGINSLHDLFYKVVSEYGAMYNEVTSKQEFSNPFGALIRQDIPAKIATIPELDSNIYIVKGRHGAGRWSTTPWIAVYDKRITTSAQKGVYIVYLVNKDTKELYLSLGLAATEAALGDNESTRSGFVSIARSTDARTNEKLKARCEQIRSDIGTSRFLSDGAIHTGSDIYDAACVYYTKYTLDSLPDDEGLKQDLLDFVDLYKRYYDVYVGGGNMTTHDDDHWPSGARDTTEFPNVTLQFDVSLREHLKAFSLMDGVSWTDYDGQNEVSGLDASGSRLRTYRKMYEKFGMIYKEEDKIHLSRLGLQIAALESELDAQKEAVLNKLRITAIDILSRYQLRNPVEDYGLNESCDVLPSIVIWKAMMMLDGKLHHQEMNRVVLRVLRMADLDEAIETIRTARDQYGNYSGISASVLDGALGAPVHTEQAPARIDPWFSFVGWGGLIIEQNVDSHGFRNLRKESIPFIEKILENPPPYYEAKDEQDWLNYYIGSAADPDAGTETADPDAVGPGGVEYAWYVGAKWGDEDKTDEFIENGTWVNGWDDKFTEEVNSVQVGDRIAIKAVFTRKRDLPFDSQGKTISCVQIKAVGIVTENLDDGKNLRVTWERCDPFKMWYIFGGWMRSTIHLVRAETSWKHKALLDFTFGDSAQDYGAFLEAIDDAEDGEEPDEVELPEYAPLAMKPEQVIFFGAPGTGKSYDINEKIKSVYFNPEERAAHTTRVTFYPDYEYSDFVGALRPVRHPDKGLDYEFIPGPMTRVLAECFKHPSEVFFLIIEEINRGNAPAIFGDLFQLLDRGPTGKSIYEINNEEVAVCLQKETKYPTVFAEKKIWFPPNLSILCSMNTADQNVFVLDTAFSRRFERVYVRIDFGRLSSLEGGAKKDLYLGEIPVFAGTLSLTEVFNDTELTDVVADLGARRSLHRNWPVFAILVNRLIDIINDRDGTDQISEDKKLGPFFASETDLSSREAFLNKVIYYLKQDVFRYVEQYFDAPFQTIYDQYVGTGDLFALLKMGE